MSSHLTKYCITLLFICFAFSINAQHHEVDLLGLQSIQYNFINDNSPVFFDGKVNLKNNNTLRGRISLNHKHNNTYSILIKTNEGYTYIPNETIDQVVLTGNEKYKQVETTFVSIEGYPKLLREVYKKDSNSVIYDSLEKPYDGRILSGVYVKENDKMTYIYDFWASGPKKDLINYINKRDGTTFKRRDFKSLNDLFAML